MEMGFNSSKIPDGVAQWDILHDSSLITERCIYNGRRNQTKTSDFACLW